MNYTKEKLGDKFYKVTITVNEIEYTFNCVVVNDTEEDLNELVEWNIKQLTNPDEPLELSYIDKRKAEYPPIEDYLDGIIKGDQAQIDVYIAACQAVKAKYPKP
jgi:hypothetical protein